MPINPTRARASENRAREPASPPRRGNEGASVVYHSPRHAAITRVTVKNFSHTRMIVKNGGVFVKVRLAAAMAMTVDLIQFNNWPRNLFANDRASLCLFAWLATHRRHFANFSQRRIWRTCVTHDICARKSILDENPARDARISSLPIKK